MQENHSGAIKGLSIAIIIISALGILSYLISFFSIPNIIEAAIYESAAGYSIDVDTLTATTSSIQGLLGFGMICGIVCLIGGIMCLGAASDPQKLGRAFGWSIAGAIVSFIGGGLITLILFIILIVFTNQDKKIYQQ